MGFLSSNAAWLAASITVPMLVMLYYLKLRRRRVAISSTLLWSMAVHDLRAQSPFQKLRRNLLLLLQLFVLASLLLAVARPTWRSTTGSGDRIIILLDHSASMNATDVAPSRLDRAKQLALELIETLHTVQDQHEGGAMVISFAQRAQVVQPFTADQSLLRQAVDSIQPTDLPTRLVSAMRVIEPLVQSHHTLDSKRSLVVYVISDGCVSDVEQIDSSQMILRYLRVGRDAGNIGIVALSGRREPLAPHRVQVLARLTNSGARPIETTLTVKLDDQVRRVVSVTIPAALDAAAGEQTVRFKVNRVGTGLLELSVDHADGLEADNTAWLNLGVSRQLDVLLITDGNAFLAKAIQATSVRQLVSVTPKQYEEKYLEMQPSDRQAVFDVNVFDRYQPKTVPDVNSLFVGVGPLVGQVSLKPIPSSAAKTQIVLDWKRNHPLMAHVALDTLRMTRPARITLPDSAHALAVGQFGPVIALVPHGTNHHVIVGFDLLKSNWPLQTSFPIFIRNCLQWLGASEGTSGPFTVRPGETQALPASSIRNENDGSTIDGLLTRVGMYKATGPVSEPWNRFGVSLLNSQESQLAPAEKLTLGTKQGTIVQSSSEEIRREIWPWFVALALALLMVEWVVYTRNLQG